MKIAVLGATGRTGRLVVRQALDAGHTVRALARDPGKVDLTHASLEVVKGDASDRDAVARLVDGVDCVVSALGPTSGRKDICSAGTENVLAARPRRYVIVSGAGLDVPGDRKDVPGKIVSKLVRWISPAVFHDKVRELEHLRASDTPWVLVRPPRLVDSPAKRDAQVHLERSPGSSISREALAAFVLRCASEDTYLGKAPFVAG